MNDSDFYLQVAHALSSCQLVEQELKLYLSESLELVRNCVDGKLPFNMSGEDYEDSPLEGLIKTFRKLSDNPVLIAELNKFKAERNFLSHKAIAQCLDPDGELGNVTKAEFEVGLAKIAPEADRLRIVIHTEANKFRGQLFFVGTSAA